MAQTQQHEPANQMANSMMKEFRGRPKGHSANSGHKNGQHTKKTHQIKHPR